MKSSINIKHISLLLLLSIIFYLPGVITSRDFWVEDEARYAEVTREMIYQGKWLVPHLNGEFYPDKPPIYFWLSALIAIITGTITPFSFMFITFLSALGCIFVNYFFSAELFGEESALISSLVLMSTLLFLFCAQIVRMTCSLPCL